MKLKDEQVRALLSVALVLLGLLWWLRYIKEILG